MFIHKLSHRRLLPRSRRLAATLLALVHKAGAIRLAGAMFRDSGKRDVPLRLHRGAIVVAALAAHGCRQPVVPPAAVATVAVSPPIATVLVGASLQLTATPRDANGTALTGRVVTWASSDSGFASVSPSALVTGKGVGWATVTATSQARSGTAAITVIASPTTGSCLDQVGSLTTLTGVTTRGYRDTSLADNAKIDARTWISRLPMSVDIAVHLGGGVGGCWSGGEILGAWPPNTIFDVMHTKYPMVVSSGTSAQNYQLENVRVFNYGQGISFDAQNDRSWRLTGCYIKYDRQAIENDFLNSGTIDDCFVEDAQTFLSSRAYTTTEDGSNNLVVIRNSLVSLSAHDGAYLSGLPSHNAFFKWSGSGYTPGIGPKVAIYRTIFRTDSDSREQEDAGEYMEPPPGKLADCEGNIMVWLGSGPYPAPLPTTFNGKPCFTIVTSRAPWDSAVAAWKGRHPRTTPDLAPPVVSLFQPGILGVTTLTGTVTLIVTAADDGDVAGVQFDLSGAPIGAEQTVNTEYRPTEPKYWDLRTKYQLVWDSRSVPNGTYTLTARGRDTAGNAQTSAGITVTVSN